MDGNRSPLANGLLNHWAATTLHSFGRKLNSICALFVIAVSLSACAAARAEEAEWIWSVEQSKEEIPVGECFFRKSFVVGAPLKGEILIVADDRYELFVNGQKVGEGSKSKQLDKYDIQKFLVKGKNIIAVQVENLNGNTAALAARVQVQDAKAGWQSYSTDASWKANFATLPFWKLSVYNDSRWTSCQSFGKLGSTPPWDRQEETEVAEQTDYERFHISKEFDVQRVALDEEVGSILAFAFNEFGQVIFSKEGGGLWLLDLAKPVEDPNRLRSYCEQVTNCQGILPLNGQVFVTGVGPEGLGLYKLSDSNRNGKIDESKVLMKFQAPSSANGKAAEHGPHGLTLGPDGMLYIVVGNHAQVTPYSETSPITHVYEGDIVLPRYEDPGGHAAGIHAPGGVIIRTDTTGQQIELFAAGLRNAYDLAFDENGELFTHDSDMESDIGAPWFRPTMLYHVTSGAEFGWRSGWAKWPDYYVDALPGICDTGRGSPTGAVFYDHVMFPLKYHHTLFTADWSEGRIMAISMKRNGASFVANSEVFLQGDPLNVTDLDVGPDGALYFATGGRQTSGGIYRIAWKDKLPSSYTDLNDPVSKLIRQPQMQSAWARQNIANLKEKMGEAFGQNLTGVAISEKNPANYRTRALEIMQLYGPLPTTELLIDLSRSQNELVRAKAAELLALKADDTAANSLLALLKDGDRLVRRKACEGLLRGQQSVSLENLKPLLVSDDRFEAWAARRMLERLPEQQWHREVMTSADLRLFIQGATALSIAYPSKRTCYEILARASQLMDGFVSDRNFIDMLRVMELALIRGEVDPKAIPAFRARIAEEFPSGNSQMNRELARLMAYLQIHEIGDRYLEYLNSEAVSFADKLHAALNLARIKTGFTSKQRLSILTFLEESRDLEGSGGSYPHYVARATRDFAKTLKSEDVPQVIAQGEELPNGALGALYLLPEKLNDQQLENIKQLDRKISQRDEEAYDQLKTGLVAVLSRSGDENSLEYLREIWQNYPERRSDVAMGLAQHPDGENWDYIVSTLPSLSAEFTAEVMEKLCTVNRRPTDPEFYRQVILKGLMLGERGADRAVKLLEHWTGEKNLAPNQPWNVSLEVWQKWYHEKHPNRPPAELPRPAEDQKWDVSQLLEYLGSEEAESASSERGHAVFAKAQCANCHRFNSQGQGSAPDLTSIAKRFSSQEILESIIYPSHVVSDQYSSQVITTVNGKQYLGLVTPEADNAKAIVQSDGKRITIPADQIESIEPSPLSAMPNNLLDGLTQQEIADLFAHLGALRNARLAYRANSQSTKVR